jgi:hypothetical protein
MMNLNHHSKRCKEDKMFDKEYSFKGTHAQKVINLTAKFNNSTPIFKTNIDVFITAAIVGYLYQTKAEPNNEKSKEGKTQATKIFLEAFNSHQTDLYFAYRLVILSDKRNEPNFEQRVNKAFKYFYQDENESDFKLFESYVLGGIDILHEKLIENASTTDDYVMKLYNFIEDIHSRYYQDTDDSKLSEELLKIARS